MATTTARTKADVDSMSKKDRLWDSLNYSYGKKRESSDKSYDQAYSQADRQALGRGMQRSSYNAQNLANINQRKVEAQNDIWDSQIADYENRLGQLEQQEEEADRWERQFAAGREDAAWNKEFQQKQYDANRSDIERNWAFQQQQYADTRSDAERNWNFTQQQYKDSRDDAAWNRNFQQQQFEANRADAAWNQAFQREQYDASRADADWQKAFNERQYADTRSDAERNWNFTQQQYADTREDADWQKAFNERQYQDSRADTAWSQAFQQTQADTAKDQWERQFGYTQETNGQQIAMQYALSILQNGQMPTAELLAQAGLSEADAKAMLAKTYSGTGGNKPTTGTESEGNGSPTIGDLFRDTINGLSSFWSQDNKTQTSTGKPGGVSPLTKYSQTNLKEEQKKNRIPNYVN